MKVNELKMNLTSRKRYRQFIWNTSYKFLKEPLRTMMKKALRREV